MSTPRARKPRPAQTARPARAPRAPRQEPTTRAGITPEGMPLAERMALCGMPCTVNGAPGAVVGPRGPFATVVDTRTGAAEQFGWFTARRILAAGGEFTVTGLHAPVVAPMSAPVTDHRLPPGYDRFVRPSARPFHAA